LLMKEAVGGKYALHQKPAVRPELRVVQT
jgi:hypothetical protein